MAIEIPGLNHSYNAAADLSSTGYLRFVKLDSSGNIAAITAATDQPFGILQDKPAAAGRAGNVMLNGMSKIIAGANLALGDKVTTDNQGRAVAAVAGTDTTKFIVGTVIEENTTAGGIVSIEFDCLNASRGA